MKHLTTFNQRELPFARLVSELLQRAGIATIIKNDQIGSALGDIPFTECSPEIWLIDGDLYPKAKNIVTQLLNEPPSPLPSWTCPACSEEVEGHFDHCWSCGTERSVFVQS